MQQLRHSQGISTVAVEGIAAPDDESTIDWAGDGGYTEYLLFLITVINSIHRSSSSTR